MTLNAEHGECLLHEVTRPFPEKYWKSALVALNAEIQRCIPYLFYIYIFKEKKMLGKTFQPFVKLHLNLLLLLFFQSTISLSSFLFLWEETSKQCWDASTASEVVSIHSIT